MKIKFVTMAITIKGDKENWLPFAEWSCQKIMDNLNVKPKDIHVLSNEVLHMGVKSSNPYTYMLDKITSIKLLLFKIFPTTDRIIFFDCDWRPVREFNIFDYIPEKKGLYFVKERKDFFDENGNKMYGLKNHYFNSGFFVADRSYSSDLFDYAFKNYNSYNRVYVEQCVMNQVFDGHVKYLDYNLNVKDLDGYSKAKVLGYHSGNNYMIFKKVYPEFNWNEDN